MELRRCLCDPIPEIEIAAHRLNEAVSAHSRGEHELASQLIRDADNPAISRWLADIFRPGSIITRKRRTLPPPTLPKQLRPLPRLATPQTMLAILERDGRYCRYCHMPLISAEVRKAIAKQYPGAVRWGQTNDSQHSALQAMWTQFDHVLPNSRGGTSDLDNVYLAFAVCNFARGPSMDALLEEQDLLHPATYPRREGAWDGLERFLTTPALSAAVPPASPSPRTPIVSGALPAVPR